MIAIRMTKWFIAMYLIMCLSLLGNVLLLRERQDNKEEVKLLEKMWDDQFTEAWFAKEEIKYLEEEKAELIWILEHPIRKTEAYNYSPSEEYNE